MICNKRFPRLQIFSQKEKEVFRSAFKNVCTITSFQLERRINEGLSYKTISGFYFIRDKDSSSGHGVLSEPESL